MKDLRENNAITLVALVITIIVLLILAGISIVTLVGDNGIISKVKEARNKTIHAGINEQMQLHAYDYAMSKKTGEINITLIQYLKNEGVIGENLGTDEEAKYQINVEELNGKKEKLGNGTYVSENDKEDTYMLEKDVITGKYIIMYYEKEDGIEIGKLDNEENISSELLALKGYFMGGDDSAIDITDVIYMDAVAGYHIIGYKEKAYKLIYSSVTYGTDGTYGSGIVSNIEEISTISDGIGENESIFTTVYGEKHYSYQTKTGFAVWKDYNDWQETGKLFAGSANGATYWSESSTSPIYYWTGWDGRTYYYSNDGVFRGLYGCGICL